MATLNHHIVAAKNKEATALFFADMLGFEQPTKLGPFAVVRVSDDTTLDFVDADEPINPLHYAFLVTETEFDQIFDRIRGCGFAYWSDPSRKDADHVNEWDDGRGVYFEDPNGHLLEILTRPYGSAGTEAKHPHPLIAPLIDHEPGGS